MNEKEIETQGAGRTIDLRDVAGNGAPKSPKRGGGPSTVEGKKTSSRNALRYGIYSPDPTAGGESPEDYQSLLSGLEAHYRPYGVQEKEWVALIAGEYVSLHRITRQISELIDLAAANVEPPRPFKYFKKFEGPADFVIYRRPEEARLTLLVAHEAPDEAEIPEDVAGDIMRSFLSTGDNDYDFIAPNFGIGSPDPEDTYGALACLIALLSAARGLEPAELVRSAIEHLETVMILAGEAEKKIGQTRAAISRRNDRRAKADLPDLDRYETLLKVKRSHERSIGMWIDRLEASQRARAGELAQPIRVQVSGDVHDEPE